jgi:YihY family inner membrane protein
MERGAIREAHPELRRSLTLVRHPFAFLLRVLRGLRDNRALILSGALAYNSLLTLIPLLALMLLVLSHVMDQDTVLAAVRSSLELVVPGHAGLLTDQIEALLEHREVIGGLGIAMLLFFSGMAFSVLQAAFDLIFRHRRRYRTRSVLLAFALPYLFALALAVGFVMLIVATSAIQALGSREIAMAGTTVSLESLSGPLVAVVGFGAEVLLLTAFYFVIPVGVLRMRDALVGALVVAGVWELLRRGLAWYFASVSLVNVVFGSIGAVVVVLLLMEIGALVILLGAQVIAEYERFVYREMFTGPDGSAERVRLD